MAASDLGKMVPGFDFLQNLMKSAGSALPPSIGQWVTPTLDPDELAKRIEELRTVQYWLEQNAKLLGTTIQALEVQRMTLSTLKSMNVSVGELSDALKLRPQAETEAKAQAAAPAEPAAPRKATRAGGARRSRAKTAAAPTAGTTIDPLQWWGALTQQFSEIAAKAVKDGSAQAAKGMAGAVGQQAAEAAGKALKSAAGMPGRAVKRAAQAAVKRGR